MKFWLPTMIVTSAILVSHQPKLTFIFLKDDYPILYYVYRLKVKNKYLKKF